MDEGSFTRAAELLHVTQPALSHQIRALERTVGAQLLLSTPHSLTLGVLPPALRRWRAEHRHADELREAMTEEWVHYAPTPVRRTLVAYAHRTPDPLTSAFVALLVEAGWDA